MVPVYVTGTTQTSATHDTGSQAAKRPDAQLGKDEFLKLLVTELKNQDIFSAAENKEFIGQLAQFSSLEQMQNVASGLEKLATAQMMVYGSSMLGRIVEGPSMDDPSVIVSGEVTEVIFNENEVILSVDGTKVRLADITGMKAATDKS